MPTPSKPFNEPEPVKDEPKAEEPTREDLEQTWVQGVNADGKHERVKSEDYAKWEQVQDRKRAEK